MCCCLIQMLGTVRWLEISWRAFWIAEPSSRTKEKEISISSQPLQKCTRACAGKNRDKGGRPVVKRTSSAFDILPPFPAQSAKYFPNRKTQSRESPKLTNAHTNLIKLKYLKLSTQFLQQILTSFAIRAVGLGEDDDAVLVDEVLSLGLGGRHGGG